MARTAPIDIRELRKSGVLKEARFFRLLSDQCNYIDPKTTKEFYMGLVRHLTKELRDKGVVRLPHIGDIALVKQQPRLAWVGPERKLLPSTYVIKFFVNSAWRKYFAYFCQKGKGNEKIDPREKILNRTLV